MRFLAPPMYDVTNIDMWKYNVSIYLKTLGMHVYLTTTKKSYLDNDKYIEANAQALVALRCTLSKDYLCMVSDCDSAFTVGTHIDLSRATGDKLCREGTLGG